MTDRTAPVAHPIMEAMAKRHSPRAYDGQALTPAQLDSILEAGRWASSCFNEQPWNFVVARSDEPEAFARLLGLLGPGNQAWAKNAGALVITVMRKIFNANGSPNVVAMYDLGQAAAMMTLQASTMGLACRQMRGFDVERARTELGVPENHDPVSAVAIGTPASPTILPEDLQAKEAMPRVRKPIADFTHAGVWGGKA